MRRSQSRRGTCPPLKTVVDCGKHPCSCRHASCPRRRQAHWNSHRLPSEVGWYRETTCWVWVETLLLPSPTICHVVVLVALAVRTQCLLPLEYCTRSPESLGFLKGSNCVRTWTSMLERISSSHDSTNRVWKSVYAGRYRATKPCNYRRYRVCCEETPGSLGGSLCVIL